MVKDINLIILLVTNILPTTISEVAKEMIAIDGTECYITKIKPWQVYKAISDYLCGFAYLPSYSLELFADFLKEVEMQLIGK